MPFEPGTKLGPYEIVEPVAGDSSESYKAEDTRLNRTVTIKLFPPHTSQDPEGRQRLEREVRVVAALNHPHICALYDVGQQGDTAYLVTEYLEGETLAQRLAKGPMELEEVLRVAIPLADALDKAHRQGVTHRGLNPSNVVLTPNGVKLAGFGFARLTEPSSRAVLSSQFSTRTAPALTSGVAASAAPYLAPEQYDGAEGDARTDIFAFGAVLYEMVTGRPAFEGETHPLLLAAIQTVDPEPISSINPLIPSALDYVVKRCLAKNPDQRLQTARDLASHLRWISEGGSEVGVSAPVAARRRKHIRVIWAAVAVVLLLTVGLLPSAYRYFEGSPELPEVNFGVYNMAATGENAGGTSVYVSPDGRWIASARPLQNGGGIYFLEVGSVTPKLLLEGHNMFGPFWSPDSQSFAFFEDGKLMKSDLSGVPPQPLCDAPFPIGGGTWNRDGVILFSSEGVLYRVPATGGEPQKLRSPNKESQETEYTAPYFLPGGQHYVYLSTSSEPSKSAIYVSSLGDTQTTQLFPSESRALYAAPGYLLFNRESTIFARGFDAKTLELSPDEPRRVTDANLRFQAATLAASTQRSALRFQAATLAASTQRSANFDVSQTGVLVYRSGSENAPGQTASGPSLRLTWFDRSGKVLEQVEAPGTYGGLDLAPDGKRFAVHKHEGNGGDNWFFNGERLLRLTFNVAQDNSNPVWSRDGKRIAFGSLRDGKWGIYVKAWDGTGKEELIVESELPKMPMSWSAGDKELVYWVRDPKTLGDIWMVPMKGEDREPRVLVQTPAVENFPVVSPDGKWMAYVSNEIDGDQIYVAPFPDSGGQKFLISVEGGTLPRWRGDSKELYYRDAPNIMAVDIIVTEGGSVQGGRPHMLFSSRGNMNIPHPTPYHRFAVTEDGQRFLVPQPIDAQLGQGIAAALAGFADQIAAGSVDTSSPGAINVLVNWTQVLKQK